MGPIAQEEEEQEEAGVELGPVRPVGGRYKLVSQEEEDLSSEAEGEREDGVPLFHTSGNTCLPPPPPPPSNAEWYKLGIKILYPSAPYTSGNTQCSFL